MSNSRTRALRELAAVLDRRPGGLRGRRTAVAALAVVVVFVTAYLLVLPAMTLEGTVSVPGIERAVGEGGPLDQQGSDPSVAGGEGQTSPDASVAKKDEASAQGDGAANAAQDAEREQGVAQDVEQSAEPEPNVGQDGEKDVTPEQGSDQSALQDAGASTQPLDSALDEVIAEGTMANREGEANAISWSLVRDDRDFVTLTVEGKGGIPDGNNQPWMSAARNVVTDIVIGEGITYVGTNAFSRLYATGGLTLPSTLTSVGTWTFELNYFSKPITVPGNLKTVGQGMFYGCNQIPSITFAEGVERLNDAVLRQAVAMGGTVTLPSTLVSTGSEDFRDCMAGTYVVTGQEGGNTTFFVQDGVLFKRNDEPAGTLTLVRYPKTREAEEYVVPDNVTAIEKWAFCYTHGLQRLVIPDRVSSVTIDSGSFLGSTLTSVYFGAGVTFPNGINDLFRDARVLVDVEFSDKIANYGTTFQNVFITCPSLLEGIIPSTITSIDGNAFNTCRAMGTLVYDARNVTSFPSTFGAGYLSYELVIGGNVEHIGAGFDVIASYATGMTFTPNTSLTVEAGAFASLPAPLSRLSDARYEDDAGNIHLTVDDQGAVYRLDPTTHEAMLAYCPPEVADAPVTSLTVPGKLTVEGGTYTVVGVGESSLLRASNLTSVTFAVPGSLRLLESNALANCPTLKSVNGKTTAREVQELLKEANSNVIIGYGAFSNTGLTDSLPDADFDKNMKGPKSLTVSGTGEHADAPELRLSVDATSPTISWPEGATAGGYTLLTGDTLKVDAAVESVKPGHTYRVFLHFTEEGGELSNLEPGETKEFEGVEARCYATVDPYTYCVEFTLEEGITTVSVPIWSIYHSPSTGGGGLLMWGEIGDPYTDEVADGVVGMDALTASRPDSEEQYLYATWTTERNGFKVNKYAAVSGSVQLVSDGEGGATVSKDLVWRINYTKTDAPWAQKGYGEDYVSTYRLQDVVTLPEGMTWRQEVAQALRDGKYKVTFTSPDGGVTRIATVMAGSTRVISFSDGYQNRVPEGVNVILDPKDERILTTSLSYKNTNGSPMGTDENTFSNVTVTLYAEALAANLDDVKAGSSLEVNNTANSTINYHHSEPSVTTAKSPINVKADEGSLSVTTEGKPAADGTVYLGEDIGYTVTLANTGSLAFTGAEGESHRIEDRLGQYAYIRPEALPDMFDEAAEKGMEFSLRIDGAQLLKGGWQEVTSVDGQSKAYVTAGNSGTDGGEHTLTITRDGVRTYRVSVGDTEIETGTDLPALLHACGYDVTSSATYTCVWEPAEGGSLELAGGGELSFAVPATVKSTFQALSTDIDADYYEEQNFSVANDVALIVTTNGEDRSLSTDSVSHDFAREVELEKNYEVTRGGNPVEGASLTNVNDRDVINYTIALRHWGSGAYQNLPIIDKLTGAQVLLVPVDENEDNEEITSKCPHKIKHGGVDYYLLSAPGKYANVVVGAVSGVDGVPLWTAATVEVTDAGTTVSWYAHELPAESYELGLRYSALVDASLSGAASFSVGNTAQLNNKPGSNLYTEIKGGGAAVTFEKRVVSRRGNDPASDVLYDVDDTVGVTRGGRVTYRLMMSNKNATPYKLTGGSIADALPNTYGAFAWERADIEVAYVTTSNEVVLAHEDGWGVSDDYEQDPQSSDPNQYYLRWSDDFSVELPAGESLYAYVTLRYPTDEEWRAYVEQANGRPVYNTFWVHALSSTVRHELSDPGYATLQKGVYGMSRNDRVQTGYGERHAYANSNNARHGVIYYVALVNTGSKRLYVNDIYDKLPRGFTYESVDKDAKLEKAPPNGINYTVVTAGGQSSSIENPLVSFNKEVTYKSATITASTSGAVDAGQNLTFHVSAGTGADAISFDEEREQYYLSKDEAIVFAVLAIASTDPRATGELATNTIAMPYTDITGSGVFAADSQEAETNGTSVNVKGFIDQKTYTDTNDGLPQVSAYELDGGETLEDRYGFANPANEATWLLSSVSQRQGNIVPAVEVSVESVTPADADSSTPYNGSANAQDTLTFGIKAYNYGSNSLSGFVMTDILPENYEFTGPVYHDKCYTADGNPQYNDGSPLFTFLSRDENGAKIQWRGGTGLIVDITLDGQWYRYDDNLMMRLWKTDDGREVLQVWLGNHPRFIPFGGYAHFTVSAKNTNDSLVSTVYTNTASFMPMRQTFDDARSPEVTVKHGITEDNLATLSPTYRNNVLGMLANKGGKGVQDSCSVNVYVGAATAASLSVSEDGVPGNSATANWMNDQITLEGNQAGEGYGELAYTLEMTNHLNNSLKRLVLIDSLPRVGDVHPFGGTERGSEYAVYFADDPEVTVRVVSSAGDVKTLDPSQYTVEYSADAHRSFTEDDWSGDSTGAWTSSPDNVSAMTTLRVVIKEGKVELSDESTVKVSFRARVADDAPASAIAWNSFGYHGMYGGDSTFEAMPASVGVRTPSAPSVVKEVVSTAGTAVAVPEETSFSFVVYEGDPLEKAYDTRYELLSVLAGRTYREFEVTVPAGESSAKLSVTPVLGGDEKWVWTQGARYNVVELPGSNAYTFDRFSRSSGASGTGTFDPKTGTYSFTYDREVTEELTCVNRSELWSLAVNKVNGETDGPLAGATFALYGPNAPAEPVKIPDALKDRVSQTVSVGEQGVTYHLVNLASFGDKSSHTWTGLTDERYYLLEVAAPEGYVLPDEGRLVSRPQGDTGSGTATATVKVENYAPYELPKTGGGGGGALLAGGAALMATAICGYVLRRRRGADDVTA